MDVYPKWIVENGTFKLRKARFHADIAESKKDVLGGGWFDIDIDKKIVYLYAKSEDFGQVPFEKVNECISKGNVKMQRSLNKFDFKYSDSLSLKDAKWIDIDCTILKAIG